MVIISILSALQASAAVWSDIAKYLFCSLRERSKPRVWPSTKRKACFKACFFLHVFANWFLVRSALTHEDSGQDHSYSQFQVFQIKMLHPACVPKRFSQSILALGIFRALVSIETLFGAIVQNGNPLRQEDPYQGLAYPAPEPLPKLWNGVRNNWLQH